MLNMLLFATDGLPIWLHVVLHSVYWFWVMDMMPGGDGHWLNWGAVMVVLYFAGMGTRPLVGESSGFVKALALTVGHATSCGIDSGMELVFCAFRFVTSYFVITTMDMYDSEGHADPDNPGPKDLAPYVCVILCVLCLALKCW
jgi:hypothetical protein